MSQTRKTRSDAGMLQITDRDIHTLTWISEQYCISFDHLRRLLGGKNAKAVAKDEDMLSPSATYNAINRWLNMGLIEQPRKIIAGHSVYIWLARRGISQLDLPYPYYTPKPSTIKHIYAVNTIRLQCEKNNLPVTWYSARAVTKLTQLKPVPDAEIRQSGGAVAIKVIERSHLFDITLHDELTALTRLIERYTKIWCFLESEPLTTIKQQYAELRPEEQDRIVFYEMKPSKSMKVQH